jgi:aminopeptidase N
MIKKIAFILCFSSVCQVQAQFACGHANSTAGVHSGPSINNNAKSDTVDILHYNLKLDLYNIAANNLKGQADIRLTPKQSAVHALTLDLLELTVDSIVQNGQALGFTYNDTLLRVQLNNNLNPGDTTTLSVYYHGSPQGDATGWGGFHRQNGYYFNLGVGFGADPHTYGRAWFPCFDNFVEKSTYSFTVLAKAPNRAFCNGLQTAYTVQGDSAVSSFELHHPIPTYLASVAVSNYEVVEDFYNGAPVPKPIWLVARAADTANMRSSFRNLIPVINSFTKHFGPYHWSKIGFVATTVGAMEHATSIHYPLSAINGNLSSEDLLAHELAHHWWGNLITCKTDADMWINEGMAEFSSHLYTEQVYGYERYIDVVQENAYQVLKQAHVRDGAYLSIHGLDHGDVYGFHVYQKGALVGHNLRSYLGYSAYDGIMQTLMQNNAFGNLNTAEMKQQLEGLSGKNLTSFFNNWVYNPGFPQFGVDALTANSITISQGVYKAPALFNDVPLDVTYFSATGDTATETYLYSGAQNTFTHNLPFTPVFALTAYAGKLLSATTTDELSLNQNRFYALVRSGLRVTASNLTDSVKLIAQQHWTSPRQTPPFTGRISQDRYWTIRGYDFQNADLSLRFSYNKNDILQDDDLLNSSEDSIFVFYREDATKPWEFCVTQNKQTGASTTDGQGYIDVDNAVAGEYVLANAAPDISLRQGNLKPGFEVFPNPATDELKIRFPEKPSGAHPLRIERLDGKLVREIVVTEQEALLSLNDLAPQTYLFVWKGETLKVVLN